MTRRPDTSDHAASAYRPFSIRIGLSTGLMLGFGGLTFIAVLVVLMLGMWSARQNTVQLTRQLATTIVDDLERSLNQYLQPAQAAVQHIGWRIENGQIDLDDEGELEAAMAGALAGMPQAAAIVFLRSDGTGLRAIREQETVDADTFDATASKLAMTAVERGAFADGVYWADVVRPEDSNFTLINVRLPVRTGERYRGLLIASVEVGELSALIRQQRLPYGGEAFLVYDNRYVLAHRRLSDGFNASVEQPLPTAAELDDAVLHAYLSGRKNDDAPPGSLLAADMGVQLVQPDDGHTYPLISRQLTRYGAKPWELGVYFPETAIQQELRRLAWASIAGVVVLLLALLGSWWLARYLSRPLSALASAAHEVRDLNLDRLPDLPASRLREIDGAASAFAAMVIGLRWFETYVPKGLVRRLMTQGDDRPMTSESREMTVLFTDIIGFTSQSEGMSADQTAAFLNDHFSQLADCIEAQDGTIDKFIGDSVMAFWGAPEAQPDHAERACRAATAIVAAMAAENGRRQANGLPPVRLRIGIHSGPAVVGNIGAPDRINYTIVGDTVNVAQRVEQLAKVVGDTGADVNLLLTAGTADQVAACGDLRLHSLGPHIVRGREGQVEIFTLSLAAAVSPAPAAGAPAGSAESPQTP